MKNFIKLIGIMAFASIIVLPMAAQTVDGGWSRYLDDTTTATLNYTVADDGVVTVTVGGTAMPKADSWKTNIGYWYASKVLRPYQSYTYIFEAWTESGTRDINIEYHHDPLWLSTSISITNERKTYTITGLELPPNGNKYFTFHCGDQLGTFYVKILEIREARRSEEPNRWSKNVFSTKTTLDYSVANDGVVTVNVGGSVSDNNYDTQIYYHYLAKADTSYTYIFEAWTQSGTRDLEYGYYWDNNTETGLFGASPITITNRRRTYTFTGLAIPKDGLQSLFFNCADQLGTFYVKVLEIREATPEEIAQASWRKWVADDSTATIDYSVARDGVVTVNVGGAVDERWKATIQYYQYTAKANTNYTYVFEAWTQRDTRNLTIDYYWDNEKQEVLSEWITITNRRTTYTITGQTILKDGIYNLEFDCADQTGRFFVKVLEIREATPDDLVRSQWRKHVESSSRTTLDYSVANDGVVTVTVGGATSDNKWVAQPQYIYPKKTNTRYTYIFEAWTQRGTRDLEIGYYHNYDTGIGLTANPITITNRRTTYTITGQPIPNDKMMTGIWFACADQTGTFYLRMIEIREARPGEEVPENWSIHQRWSRSIHSDSTATLDYSIADDGVVTTTVGGRVMPDNWKVHLTYRYTAKANTRYTYVIEAWTQRGTRDLGIRYYSDVDTDEGLFDWITITNQRTTYTITGQTIPKDGTYPFEFWCANQLGTFNIRILEIREATPEDLVRAQWRKHVEPQSRATLDYSVADDGVVTVTVGGRADNANWHRTQIHYQYTAKANTSYTYVFEAWTQSGTRELGSLFYYWDNDKQESLEVGYPITITNQRTTYTLTGQPIPRDGTFTIWFCCANQLGTFYLKVLEIREN